MYQRGLLIFTQLHNGGIVRMSIAIEETPDNYTQQIHHTYLVAAATNASTLSSMVLVVRGSSSLHSKQPQLKSLPRDDFPNAYTTNSSFHAGNSIS